MDAIQVARACDELHQAVDQDPGLNLDCFAASLALVKVLKDAAGWDYPVRLLTDIEVLMVRWFSPATWRDEAAKESCRQLLVELIAKLEGGWERPSA